MQIGEGQEAGDDEAGDDEEASVNQEEENCGIVARALGVVDGSNDDEDESNHEAAAGRHGDS